jgi:hypothetical protein
LVLFLLALAAGGFFERFADQAFEGFEPQFFFVGIAQGFIVSFFS